MGEPHQAAVPPASCAPAPAGINGAVESVCVLLPGGINPAARTLRPCAREERGRWAARRRGDRPAASAAGDNDGGHTADRPGLASVHGFSPGCVGCARHCRLARITAIAATAGRLDEERDDHGAIPSPRAQSKAPDRHATTTATERTPRQDQSARAAPKPPSRPPVPTAPDRAYLAARSGRRGESPTSVN